jgi:mannose-1-phosphate guanylyltransferase / phosphomannomutase
VRRAGERSRAVFLDRDGTIIREVDLLRSVRQLRLLPGAADAIRSLNRRGFRVIVVTNQPVIARGWLTEEGVEEIHRVLARRLRRLGAALDAVYFCPHHPQANLLRYRVRCRCRKPGAGLIRRAAREFGIDLSRSFIVGDRTPDILAGERAGVTTLVVGTGYGGRDGKYAVTPDHRARNLREAARIIASLTGRRR